MEGDGFNFITGSVKLTARLTRIIFSSNFFYNIKTVSYLSKYRMAVIKEWSRGGGDEELGAVGAGSGVRHGEDSWAAVA